MFVSGYGVAQQEYSKRGLLLLYIRVSWVVARNLDYLLGKRKCLKAKMFGTSPGQIKRLVAKWGGGSQSSCSAYGADAAIKQRCLLLSMAALWGNV